ncbi:hypothetical protein V865_002451 [Kwoniella europaea PYCC6329]|uniref:NADP-dependent oxidoreductase domain-containing protein n=1 Tax=Kwoniella europaea PYCC6329 TaxID=1423913 RepID=A0AAX4KD51_9TREE
MTRSFSDTVTLHTGGEIPGFGFGAGGLKGREALDAVTSALLDGYRLIDSGQRYGNEREIGLAVAQSGIPRSEITLSTKWCAPLQPSPSELEKLVIPEVEEIVRGLRESVIKLNNGKDVDQGGYIDLVLLHHSGPTPAWREQGWKALSQAKDEGWVRNIGVSNFGIKQLESLPGHVPVLVQLELNPWIQQRQVVKYCQDKGIVVQAYCPTARYQADRIGHPTVIKLAEKYNKPSGHILLRWSIQKDLIPLPRSSKEERIHANRCIFDFQLDDEEMAALDSLDMGSKGRQTPIDPDNLP